MASRGFTLNPSGPTSDRAPTPAMSVADARDYALSFDAFAVPAGTLWAALGPSFIAGGLAVRIWAIGRLGRAFTSTVQVQKRARIGQHWAVSPGATSELPGAYGTFLGCAVFLQAWIGLVVAAACMGLQVIASHAHPQWHFSQTATVQKATSLIPEVRGQSEISKNSSTASTAVVSTSCSFGTLPATATYG